MLQGQIQSGEPSALYLPCFVLLSKGSGEKFFSRTRNREGSSAFPGIRVLRHGLR